MCLADGKGARENFTEKVRRSQGSRKEEKEGKRNKEGAAMKAAALIGTLTVSFYTLLLFSFSFSPSRTHHVIFEEIGEMAGALSYIHIIIPINISGLLQAVMQFREKVTALKASYINRKEYAVRLDKYDSVNMNGPQKHALFHFHCQITYVMDLMLQDADTIQGSIDSLRASLPREEDAPGGSSQQHKM
jgi:hypothetical protein